MWYTHYFQEKKLNKNLKNAINCLTSNLYRELLEQIPTDSWRLNLLQFWTYHNNKPCIDRYFHEYSVDSNNHICLTDDVSFTKTARKKYDIAVFITLYLLDELNLWKHDWDYSDSSVMKWWLNKRVLKRYVKNELAYTYNYDKLLSLYNTYKKIMSWTMLLYNFTK